MNARRRIIHVDMDCFYAAVEIREQPHLKDHPVAVGGSSERGVLTTCNYEARKYGVHSAMPVFKAKQLCPHLTLLPVRFDLYKSASRDIRKILNRYSDLVEPLSLDEAYLDVSHIKQRGADIASEIRSAIEKEVSITASAGIAPNKLIAKIASDWNKPNGQCVVSPSNVDIFIKALPVRKLWGVGPKSAERMSKLGIQICADLQKMDKVSLSREFGSFGLDLYKLCRGIDDRPVQPNRIRKSLSNERTFTRNLETLEECESRMKVQFDEMLNDLKRSSPDRQIAKALVKLKFSNFRKTTAEAPTNTPNIKLYSELLREAWGRSGDPVRLLGVGVRFKETSAHATQLELALKPRP